MAPPPSSGHSHSIPTRATSTGSQAHSMAYAPSAYSQGPPTYGHQQSAHSIHSSNQHQPQVPYSDNTSVYSHGVVARSSSPAQYHP